MAVTITMPQLGETVTEGTILAWVKQIGEYVAEDDILVEISTDKVDTEVPSPAAGVLTEILVPAGTTVDVGTALAILTSEGEEPSDAGANITTDDSGDVVDMRPTAVQTERRGVLSPVVRRLAAEYAVDLAMVPGTGDGGRITRRDVEMFVAARGDAPTSSVPPLPVSASSHPVQATAPKRQAMAQTGDVREISRLRSRIATNMLHAKQSAAHVWTSVEVDYERVAVVRAKLGPAFKATEGFSPTYLPFVARATMDALTAYPEVNSLFDIEAGTQTFNRSIHLGIAVDLEQEGLVVVNIRDADSMTLKALARSIRRMARDARAGNLGPDDLAGFTFSITNPGPFGSFMSAPIIPVPNSAILSTDTVVKRAVVVELPDGSDGLAIHHIGYLGLSWDHRVFDGATATLFLRRIKENLETWDWEQELS